ncbi:Actin patches distal protein 1 [Phytophthora cactorum]|nr:Actin patches distal protein 1 [Phytophthora cactorum]
MHRVAKSLATRASSVAASRRLLRPQSIGHCVVFFSTDAPLMGKRLTPEEIAERRAKRVERRAASGDDAAKRRRVRHVYRGLGPPVPPPLRDCRAGEHGPERMAGQVGADTRACSELVHGRVGEALRRRHYEGEEEPAARTAAIPYTGMCSGGLRDDSAKPTESLKEGAHDILVFPDFVRVHNVVPSQISTLVSKSLEKGLDLPAVLEQENLQYTRMEEAYHMMVCGHAARDERCGCKGPELLQWLKNSAADANKPLNLWTSSHYGGHRYAAACIVYPSGDWFGLLNDEYKAKGMLDAVNDADPLRIYELWRGRIGLTAREMHQAVKERVDIPDEVAENA